MSRGGDEGAEAAHLLLNRVVLALLAETRRHGGFGEDEEALRARAVELAAGLGADPMQPPLELKLLRGGRIELKLPFGDGASANAGLREDGYVLSGSTSRMGESRIIRLEDQSPEQVEEHRRWERAEAARKGKPGFSGAVWRRTVAAPPQPGADLRITAIQIFEDGFLLDFTYDNDPSPEEIEATLDDPRPPIDIEDDIGTEYYQERRASWGGSPVSFSTFSFAPPPPAEAAVLLVSTVAGTVEIDLN